MHSIRSRQIDAAQTKLESDQKAPAVNYYPGIHVVVMVVVNEASTRGRPMAALISDLGWVKFHGITSLSERLLHREQCRW